MNSLILRSSFVLLSAAILCPVANAEKYQSASEAEVVKFVKQYVVAFNAEDVAKVIDCHHFPHSSLNQDTPLTFVNDRDEMQMEQFYQLIKNNFGWKENQITKLSVLHSSDDKASVYLGMNGVDTDGAPFTKVVGILGLSKVSGKWGFSQVSWHFPPAE
jgi:hypothetical protein